MTPLRSKPLRFMIVGIANTLCGLGVIYAAKLFAAVGDVPANALGYAVGIGLGFALNRIWTFKDRGSISATLARYLLVIGIGYSLNLAAVIWMINSLGVNAYLAQAFGIPPYVLSVYLGSRWFVFRHPIVPACETQPRGGADGLCTAKRSRAKPSDSFSA